MLNYLNLCSHSYVEDENTILTETGMSKIIEIRKKKHTLSKVQLRNAFVRVVAFNTELHPRNIKNLPEHQ